MKSTGFADIYSKKRKGMSANTKKVAFYLWVGFAYMMLWVLSNMSEYTGRLLPFFLNNIWRVIYVIVLNFIFFEYIVPLVLGKKRYVIINIALGILFLWIFMMLWSYGLYVWRMFGKALAIYSTVLIRYDSLSDEIQSQVAYSMGSVFFFGIIRHIYNYIKLKQAAQQLQIEKQAAELSYLRSQTNPHFLFNTLNNIYSLSRDKSDLAPESILRLSKILRFMLYETNGEYISIEQEIKIIGDYIALERLRYDETLRINFNYDIEDMKQAVPPLLLIPLVENAFKHGVSETRGHPFVDIHLSVRNRQLTFIVKNSTEDHSDEKIVKENIGLSNLRQQLKLLYKFYDLRVQQYGSVFTATLQINLSSHV
ncbi:MAG TPA: histidine kinase [Chitinophagaceae bacterium]